MPLNVGDRLGHYDVTALIGEGGPPRSGYWAIRAVTLGERKCFLGGSDEPVRVQWFDPSRSQAGKEGDQ